MQVCCFFPLLSSQLFTIIISYFPSLISIRFITVSANQAQLRQEKIEEREAKHKKMFLAVFLAVKELIAELETQKLSSDTIKEVMETTTYDINFLQSEVCFQIFPIVLNHYDLVQLFKILILISLR